MLASADVTPIRGSGELGFVFLLYLWDVSVGYYVFVGAGWA